MQESSKLLEHTRPPLLEHTTDLDPDQKKYCASENIPDCFTFTTAHRANDAAVEIHRQITGLQDECHGLG